MSRVDLLIPDIGNFSDVAVVDVLVKPGDVVDIDSPLVTLETDKASMDVPATAAGTIAEVLLRRGDKVSKGSLIARVEAGTAAVSAASPSAAATSAPAARQVPPTPASGAAAVSRSRASASHQRPGATSARRRRPVSDIPSAIRARSASTWSGGASAARAGRRPAIEGPSGGTSPAAASVAVRETDRTESGIASPVLDGEPLAGPGGARRFAGLSR